MKINAEALFADPAARARGEELVQKYVDLSSIAWPENDTDEVMDTYVANHQLTGENFASISPAEAKVFSEVVLGAYFSTETANEHSKQANKDLLELMRTFWGCPVVAKVIGDGEPIARKHIWSHGGNDTYPREALGYLKYGIGNGSDFVLASKPSNQNRGPSTRYRVTVLGDGDQALVPQVEVAIGSRNAN